MYSFKRYVYENVKSLLPDPISDTIASYNNQSSLIYGDNYVKYSHKLEKGNDKIETNDRLLSIVNGAIKNVPYYRNLYKDKVINSIEDFKNTIEPIDKNIVLNNFRDFIADNIILKQYDYVTTSGTSGVPLRMYLPKERYSIEIATLHYYWSKIGYNFSKRGVIRMGQLKGSRKIEINPLSKEYIFDGYKINDSYLLDIYNYLRKYNISFLHGYPSNLYLFGKFLLSRNLDYSFIQGMFSSSEQVPSYMHSFFAETLRIPLVDFYGHTEKLIFAATDGFTSDYHVDSHYGYVELLDSRNIGADEGELVGTTLNNVGMPLIRYKTGDEAILSRRSLPEDVKYGNLILQQIKGRSSNSKIYYKNGDFITATALVLHGELYKKIDGLQYFQKEKGELEIRVVTNKLFTDQTRIEIINLFKEKFNNKLNFRLVAVAELERADNGKLLLLISKV